MIDVPTLHVIVITEDKLLLKINNKNNKYRNGYDNNIIMIDEFVKSALKTVTYIILYITVIVSSLKYAIQ